MHCNIILLALAGAAAISDVLTDRIPNRLILSGLFCAFLCGMCGISVTGGASVSAWSALLGMAIPLVFPGLLYVLHMMGAGDIKLLCMIGAFLGPWGVIEVTARAFVAGAVMSAVLMFIRGNAIKRLRVAGTYIKACFLLRRALPYSKEVKKDGRMHFGVAVFAGLIWWYCF